MKILRIYPNLPPIRGGMETHIQELSRFQLNRGHQVQLIHNQGQGLSDSDIKIWTNLKIMDLKPRFLWVLFFNLSVIITAFSRGLKAEILHVHGDWSNLLLMQILRVLTGAQKIVFSVHGQIQDYSGIKKSLLYKQVRKTDLVFCTGYDSYLTLRDHCNAYFQPSGVKDDFYGQLSVSNNKSFTIIAVANLVKVKNLKLFVRIAAELPDCDFVLIGDGPEKKQLAALSQELGLNNINFAGSLPGQKIAAELKQSHLFLLTSKKEGTSTSILEALSCGLPVVCSPAGGIKHTIKDGINGYVIDSFDEPVLYAEKIRKLKNEKELYQQIRSNNSKFKDQFSWAFVGENITNLMCEEN